MTNKTTEEKGGLKSIAWASVKLSCLLFVMKLLTAFFTNGIGQTLERWCVEAGFFVLMFVLMFLALVLISRFDERQVEKEKGPN